MAGLSLIALLDDIATVLDDVALMTKVAAKKTAGVLGDDLALNAQQVSGVRADRELPVVWAVAKGSLLNKLILVPLALLLSIFLPVAIHWLLMLGGLFLCFEGVEKVFHALFAQAAAAQHDRQQRLQANSDPAIDLVAFEKQKIKGAIRTDFILSAEIIVIALGTVSGAALLTQSMVVSGIALIMTAGVYGLVAAIVKLDDVGLYLLDYAEAHNSGRALRGLARGLLGFAPRLMKLLVLLGTAAMFLVGGGILVHGLSPLAHLAHSIDHQFVSAQGPLLLVKYSAPLIFNAAVGLLAGVLVLLVLFGGKRLRGAFAS